MNATLLLGVALGGAAGSLARYLSMSAIGAWFAPQFPYATLFVNVLGSLVMGLLVEASALVWSPSPDLRAFLTVGILGGFTTFSTFSLDTAVLIERNQWPAAFAYAVLSVVLSVGALFAGMYLIRHLAR
jgi:CrcB protein